MHQDISRRAGHEGLDDVVDDQGMRAIFPPPDIFLQYPGVMVGDRHAGDMVVRFTDGAPGEKGHVAAGSVVDAGGFHDVALLGRGRAVQHLVHGRAGRDIVGFRHGQTELASPLNEGVFLVQGAGGCHVELDGYTVGPAVKDFLGLRVFNRRRYARAAHPKVHLLPTHELKQVVDIEC